MVNRRAAGTDFGAMVTGVNSALDAYESAEHIGEEKRTALTSARSSLADWTTAHSVLMDDLSNGRHDEALAQATDAARLGTAASSFAELDGALSRLIADTRATMRGYIADSLDATRALGAGMGVLTTAAVVAMWLGIRPRLQEYM